MKVIISTSAKASEREKLLSAQPSPSALAKKKADLSAKIEKQRAALDELTAQLKDVNK
jgi:2-oxo-4-hydroxy-4-carboxy--5-ureidoimidazoline (OHCU) decarboxylase